MTAIVPTYNERANIVQLLNQLVEVVDKVVVVDDNSPDGTGRLARQYGNGAVKTVIRPRKMGLNGAVLRGALETNDENLIVIDGDLSHPPSVIPLIAESLKNHDIVIGTRSRIIGWGFRRRLMSTVATLLAQVLHFRWGVKDPMSGFFGVKKSILQRYRDRISSRGYKVLFTILDNYYRKDRHNRITGINYTFINRRHGDSKLSMNEITNYVRSVFRFS